MSILTSIAATPASVLRSVAKRSVVLSGREQTTVAENWRTNKRLVDTWDNVIKSGPGSMIYLRLAFASSNRRMYAHMGGIAKLPEGTSVLDIPSGGGVVLRTLRPEHKLEYTAADISPLMLEKVRAEADRRGLNYVECKEADATQLPFADGQFDVVATYNGLHCLPDPRAAFQEMVRVTRPGGSVRGNIYVRGANPLSDAFIALWVRSNALDVVVTAEEFTGWIDGAGFQTTRIEYEGAAIFFDCRKPE